ncbi:hypothetical protein SFRURICE_018314 [Spodoptera frugiperda]|nr:hypothetical protein SFRURICE_018314 [Spodoptera frugiperda]
MQIRFPSPNGKNTTARTAPMKNSSCSPNTLMFKKSYNLGLVFASKAAIFEYNDGFRVFCVISKNGESMAFRLFCVSIPNTDAPIDAVVYVYRMLNGSFRRWISSSTTSTKSRATFSMILNIYFNLNVVKTGLSFCLKSFHLLTSFMNSRLSANRSCGPNLMPRLWKLWKSPARTAWTSSGCLRRSVGVVPAIVPTYNTSG